MVFLVRGLENCRYAAGKGEEASMLRPAGRVHCYLNVFYLKQPPIKGLLSLWAVIKQMVLIMLKFLIQLVRGLNQTWDEGFLSLPQNFPWLSVLLHYEFVYLF